MELPDAYTSGSSMLPQKKNPDAAELARAKASRVVADYTGLQTLLAKLPLAYNKDLQEDKHFLFDAIDTLDMLLPALSGMLAEANFRTDRMAAACEDGYLLPPTWPTISCVPAGRSVGHTKRSACSCGPAWRAASGSPTPLPTRSPPRA